MRIELAVLADSYLFANYSVRANAGSFANVGGGCDEGSGVNSGGCHVCDIWPKD